MPLSEVFVALETGVMDGQENPFAQIYSSRFHEIQRYLSLTGHVYTPAYVAVGIKKWEKFPTEIQQILAETARETQEFVYATAQDLEQDLLARLKDSGIEINEAHRESFVEASQAIYEEFSTTVPGGQDLVRTALALGGS